ncbi:MAG: hypothetical protein ABR985_12820 [Methanotrichaceae archaeon]|jgi:hypothetical protein
MNKSHMQGSDKIDSKLREMILSLEDESASSVDLEAILKGLDEHDRRISETLDDLLEEVDRLIQLSEDLEKDAHCNR